MKCEWESSKIGDLGKIITGKTPPTKNQDLWDGNIPFITPRDLQNGKTVLCTERTITSNGIKVMQSVKLPPKSVCVSCIGNIGYVAMTCSECISNQQINSIIVNSNNDADFVYYLMKSLHSTFKNYEGQSTTLSILNKKHFSDIDICIPPLDIQKQIAAILSALDEKIATNRAINENLERQAQALVKEYCSSTDSEIALGSIMNFVNGFAFQSKSYQKNGKYRIVTIKNVQDGRIDTQGAAYIDEVPAKMKNECYLRVGDILLSLTGNVGRVGIVFENNLLLNQRVAKFTSSKDILPLLYFFFRLSETKVSLETIAKGTAQQNLSPIETLKLSFPYDEDKALILSQTLKPMFDSIVNNSVESSKLAQLRDSLLPKLMSGELDVSDIDL